jgi:cyclic pyranopterin phosphate synthase
MNLKEIGFYTLSNERANQVSLISPLWRCELILTERCNFNCPYCRGRDQEIMEDISAEDAEHVVNKWADSGLKNIRFSGGEPTLWKYLPDIISIAKVRDIERIAVSTNGSANAALYEDLISVGVNDFSISLDACCSSTGDMMSGSKNTWLCVI